MLGDDIVGSSHVMVIYKADIVDSGNTYCSWCNKIEDKVFQR